MAYPGGIDVVYDTVGKRETFEVGDARAASARHPREGGRARADLVGGHAAVLQGDLDGRLERVRRSRRSNGVRQHGIEHYLDLVADGRVDLTGMLTHTFPLDDWRDAFTALATQATSGAIKVAFDFRPSERERAG